MTDSQIVRARAECIANGAGMHARVSNVSRLLARWIHLLRRSRQSTRRLEQIFKRVVCCSSLTTFPAINTSSGTNFSYACNGCSSLATTFPEINTSSGTLFTAWYAELLISDNVPGQKHVVWNIVQIVAELLISFASFPAIDTSSGTDFAYAFWLLISETFPANVFDNCTATNFTGSFGRTAD